jgi:ribosomal-protein-alanine N-acetyltransferase
MKTVRAMTPADLPAVAEIDRLSFTLPWSETAFRKELADNDQAHFFVADVDGRVAGVAGYWFIVDECHISTVAVHPDWRRQGLGELLVRSVLRHARSLGAVMATLEVRVSNAAAIRLYEKFGFKVNRRRRGYYRDNHEDALEMLAQPLEVEAA